MLFDKQHGIWELIENKGQKANVPEEGVLSKRPKLDFDGFDRSHRLYLQLHWIAVNDIILPKGS